MVDGLSSRSADLWLFIFVGSIFIAGGLKAGDGDEAKSLQYLVVLDFASDFDGGALGKQVGRMFRAKCLRHRLFSVDTEIDWEERCGLMAAPSAEADLQAVAREAREKLGCDILIWGRVIQPFVGANAPRMTKTADAIFIAPDESARRLLLEVHALDLHQEPLALAMDEIYECSSNYEIAAKVGEALKILTGHSTPAARAVDDPVKRLAGRGANLCAFGDFEAGGTAQGGEALARLLKGWLFPLPQGISLVNAADCGGQNYGFALRYDLSPEVAATTGLFCYSPYIPIKPDTYYQCSFRVKTDGPSVIMFVKGYRDLPLDTPRYDADGHRVEVLRQEVFKHQRRFYGKKGEWEILVSQPFLPRSVRPEHMPQFLRVQLYAYYPPGSIWFDDVCVKECAPMP